MLKCEGFRIILRRALALQELPLLHVPISFVDNHVADLDALRKVEAILKKECLSAAEGINWYKGEVS
jgi:hypothetical protein